MGGNASKTWQELSGSKNWEGLLDPFNDDLRKYIIHYGEGAQAIGDAFNNQDESDARGFSRYPMEGFFHNVGLDWFDYDVTQFFYAKEQRYLMYEVNWIGYVAVATDAGKEKLGRRDILVVWRGTERTVEAALDIDDTLTSASDIFAGHEDVMVHNGWHEIYTSKNHVVDTEYIGHSAGEQAVKEVKKQVEQLYKNNKDEEISITVAGHSMGAALATLNAMDIVANGHNYPEDHPEMACQVTVFAFASPKVGNEKFKELYDNLNKEKNLHALRILNAIDIVPNLPPVKYEHVGEQFMIDSRQSTHLKSINEVGTASLQIAHQLEPMLHVVAGWNGFDGTFDIKQNRDYSLANKDMDALKSNYKVPASWWVVQNKGMVQTIKNGISKWTLQDYKPPPPQE
ncbi:hypothetical protein CRG98_017800 [Punica granatum]|uniref:Phospholipase A1 n=1 Tax=Punica granatum TaxID=22663 RepID=A0A2I0K173_PUNGR|nr:hypothetical protein CRG98_017800 [Punica granatum]